MSKKIARRVTTGLISLALAGGASVGLAATTFAAPVGASVSIAAASWRVGDLLTVVSPTDGFANVRSGPSTRFAVLTTFTTGTRVKVLERSGTWTRVVNVVTGRKGWVANSLLRTSWTPPVAPPTWPTWPAPVAPPIAPAPTLPACRVLFRPLWGENTRANALTAARNSPIQPAYVHQGADGVWYVQLGVYNVRSNATAKLTSATNRGIAAFIAPSACGR